MDVPFSSIDSAMNDLKRGRLIIVVDDENRENEGDLVCLAEAATPDNINFMITHGRGLVCVPMEEKRLAELEIPLMVNDNQDSFGTAFTVPVDHLDAGTGISAFDRAFTIQKLIGQNTKPEEFRRPGHIFPLKAKAGGVLEREGHTEAAVDLAKLANSYPAAVICEVINEDGTMARLPELRHLAKQFNLKIVSIKDLVKYRKQNENVIEKANIVNFFIKNSNIISIFYKSKLNEDEYHVFFRADYLTSTPIIDFYVERAANSILSLLDLENKEIDLKKLIMSVAQDNRKFLFFIRRKEEIAAEHVEEDDYIIISQILRNVGMEKVSPSKQHIPMKSELIRLGIEVEYQLSST